MLERRSELQGVSISFDDGQFEALVRWNVGAWDTEAEEWVGQPDKVLDTLKHTNADDMKRFNDALGVMHAECVRHLVVAQRAVKEARDEAQKAKEMANEAAFLVGADKAAHAKEIDKLKRDLAAEERLKLSARENAAEWTSRYAAEVQARRSWLYRLTFGFFGG